MRNAAERLLCNYTNFRSVAGTAEATTLPDGVADLVVAGSALHWFDRERCLQEFRRILKPKGYFLVLSNRMRREGSPFMRAYRELFRRYSERRNRPELQDSLKGIFGEQGLSTATVDNSEYLEYRQLVGRALSYSTIPLAGHPQHELMLGELHSLFQRLQARGKVLFETDTVLYWGKLRHDRTDS